MLWILQNILCWILGKVWIQESSQTKVEFDRLGEHYSNWIVLLLLKLTDVLTTCAVVIFRIKAKCITSVDGIILWFLIWLVNYITMLLVICQLSHDVIGYVEDS